MTGSMVAMLPHRGFYVVVVVLAIVLTMSVFSPVSAAGMEKSNPSLEGPIQVEYVPISIGPGDILTAVLQFVGLKPKEQKIEVSVGKEVLAVLPTDSSLTGMSITPRCLTAGYGTDLWFRCEQVSAIRDRINPNYPEAYT